DGGADTGGIHEGEHAVQPFVFCADQVTGGFIKVHDTGGGSLDAHFLFQAATGDVVALTDATVAVGQELGNDEQADAPGALGRIRQAGQHDVDNVFSQVVVTGRNEDLGAGDLV